MKINRKDFEDFIEKLKKASKDKIVLVEGKKDKAALESFGVTNIVSIKKPIYALVEQIQSSGKECIILVDLDKEGRKLYSRFKAQLSQFGVKLDDSFREFLFKTKLRQIEGINHYMDKLD